MKRIILIALILLLSLSVIGITNTACADALSDYASIYSGTWRDQVYREGKDWIQREVIFDFENNMFWINTLASDSSVEKVLSIGPKQFNEIKENYVKIEGGWSFTYDAETDTLDTPDDFYFTPPLERYSNETNNTAFGVNPDDYKAKSQTVTGSTVPKGGLFTKAEAFTVAQYIVKQELVSPSSAKFCKVTEATATFNSTTGKWTVKGWVESKNTYGTLVRQNFTAVFKPVKKNGDIGYNSGTALLY